MMATQTIGNEFDYYDASQGDAGEDQALLIDTAHQVFETKPLKVYTRSRTGLVKHVQQQERMQSKYTSRTIE